MQVQVIPVRSLLNPTGGYLKEGFTHTINPYRGCALGNSLCGLYCYAQWNPYHTQGRAWGSFLDIKADLPGLYRRQYDQLKQPSRGSPKPLRIFLSSVTEPYPPQERIARRTRELLEAMIERPPDGLVIQTHTPLVAEDGPLLQELHRRTSLQVHITVETDKETLPAGFPRHAYPVDARIAALKSLQAAGLRAIATVSPLLPLDDPRRFAHRLERVCDRVILDHYLLGDGSPEGRRTKHTSLPELLEANGYGAWTRLETFNAVVETFREVFGDARVGISRSGFNAVER